MDIINISCAKIQIDFVLVNFRYFNYVPDLRKNHHAMSRFRDTVIILGEDSVLYLCVSCLYKLTKHSLIDV